MFRNRERPWQTASPDALIREDGEYVATGEGKTALYIRDWGEPGPDQSIPLYYQCQGQWQMDTLGLERVYFPVCGPFELFNQAPKYYVLEYNARVAGILRQRCQEFLEDVKMGFEPDPDYTAEPDREALRYKNTAIDEAVVEVPDDVALAFLRSKALAAQLDTHGKADAAKVAELMANAKTATWRGITLGARTKGTAGKPPKFTTARGLADKAAEILTTHDTHTEQEGPQ